MSDTLIYHNPRCSKSRQTLQLLQERGIEPEVREYLKQPLSTDELKQLLSLLNIAPRALLRTTEADYQEAGLENQTISDAAIIEAMARYPKLVERPIVVHQGQARIGRPPEQVLEIF